MRPVTPCIFSYKHATCYLVFCLCNYSHVKNYYVHRYVYECFRRNIPKDKVVDHIDNDKTNNNTKNLQLLTPKENSRKCHCKNLQSFNTKTKEIQICKNVTMKSKDICIFIYISLKVEVSKKAIIK